MNVSGRMARMAVLAVALGAVLAGCATNRGVINVSYPAGTNPEAGRTVAIVKVTDSRVFEVAPKQASVPSLKGGDIANPAVTARAIARKRNSYGKALGDILLPEGRSVTDVVREAVTGSLREKGYRVVEAAAPGAGAAVPIEVDIRQFWSWFTPGFWAISLEFEAIVQIKGDVFAGGSEELVRGYAQVHGQAAGTGAWLKTINKGLEDLAARIREKLRTP
jgi:hypothetical protein